jgi:hypothetical protein
VSRTTETTIVVEAALEDTAEADSASPDRKAVVDSATAAALEIVVVAIAVSIVSKKIPVADTIVVLVAGDLMVEAMVGIGLTAAMGDGAMAGMAPARDQYLVTKGTYRVQASTSMTMTRYQCR